MRAIYHAASFHTDITYFVHSAGGVVLHPNGHIIVVRQRDGSWSLPKGKMKEGEDPREAALREIAEETGITDLKLVKLLGSYSRYALTNTGGENMDRFKRITIYLFTTQQEELRPIDRRIPEARWVTKEEAASILTHPKDQEFFASVMPEMNVLLVG